MPKKLIIASMGAILSFGAFAAPHGDNMMSKLTDEQKSCIEQYGCAKPEKAERGEKPEMSADQKEAMTCMKNAMAACGVEMPKHDQGEKSGKKHHDK